MRLFALVLLCVVVAMHHGVPLMGHGAHGPTGPAGVGMGHVGHDAPVGDDASDDGAPEGHPGLVGACLAVLVAAGLLIGAFAMWRRLILRGPILRLVRGRVRLVPGPPPHGPPRPIRPCVMLR